MKGLNAARQGLCQTKTRSSINPHLEVQLEARPSLLCHFRTISCLAVCQVDPLQRRPVANWSNFNRLKRLNKIRLFKAARLGDHGKRSLLQSRSHTCSLDFDWFSSGRVW